MKKIIKLLACMCLAVLGLMASFFAVACGDDDDGGYTPTEIKLNVEGTELNLTAGDTFDILIADSTYFKDAFIFESSDQNVVTVSGDGHIVAVGEGTAKITVKSGDISSELTVKVSRVYKYSIEIDKMDMRVGVGSKFTVTARVLIDGKDCDETVEWSSDEADTAKICLTKNGNSVSVEVKQVGEYKLIATCKGVSKSVKITVTDTGKIIDYDTEQYPEIVEGTNYATSENGEFWFDKYETVTATSEYIKFKARTDSKINVLSIDGNILKNANKKFAKAVLTFSHDFGEAVEVEIFNDEVLENSVFTGNIIDGDSVILNTADFIKDNSSTFYIVFAETSNGDEVKVTSLTFTGKNLATKEYISLWSSDCGTVTTMPGGIGVAWVSSEEKPVLFFSSDKIAEMKNAGYNEITFKALKSGTYNFWFQFYGGKNPEKSLLTSKEYEGGENFSVSIDDLYNETTEKYELKFTTAGWWDTKHYLGIGEFTFVKGETIEAKYTRLLNNPDFEWASETGKFAWSSPTQIVFGKTTAFSNDALIAKYDSNGAGELSLDPLLLELAEAAGYEYLTLSMDRMEWSGFWAEIYAGGGSYKERSGAYGGNTPDPDNVVYYQHKGISSTFTKNIPLSDLKNSDGYGLFLIDVANKSVAVTSLKFSSKAIDEENLNKALKPVIEANIGNASYNWVNEDAALAWSSENNTIIYQDGGFVSTPADTVSVNKLLFEAAEEQGYDYFEISAEQIGTYNFWLNIFGAGKTEGTDNLRPTRDTVATSPYSAVIPLDSLKDDQGVYSLQISALGAWEPEHKLKITSLTFMTEESYKQNFVLENLKNPDYNWANADAIFLWNSTGEITYGATDHTTTTGLKAPDFTLDASLISKAISQGYESLIITASRQGWSGFWAEVYGGKNYGSKLHATSGEGYVFTRSFDFEELLDLDGYGLKILDDANKSAIFVESLTFTSRAIEEEKVTKALAPIIEANISNHDYNWANENVAMAWKSERNTISFDGGFKSTYDDKMSVNKLIFEAAEDEGYTQVKLTIEKVGSYNFWLDVYGAGETDPTKNLRPGVGAEASTPCTFIVSLSDLKDGDGVYSLQISAAGGSGSSNSYQVKVTSLTFTTPAIEKENVAKALAQLIEDNIGTASYNWANADAMGLWSNVDNTLAFDGGVRSYCKTAISVDKALFEAAEDEGYTGVSLTVEKVGGYNFWLKVYGAGKTGDNDNLRPGGEPGGSEASNPCDFTVSLSDLKDGDGVYSLQISAEGGWEPDHYVKVTSLKFVKE